MKFAFELNKKRKLRNEFLILKYFLNLFLFLYFKFAVVYYECPKCNFTVKDQILHLGKNTVVYYIKYRLLSLCHRINYNSLRLMKHALISQCILLEYKNTCVQTLMKVNYNLIYVKNERLLSFKHSIYSKILEKVYHIEIQRMSLKCDLYA